VSRPIETLMSEHRLIEEVLDALLAFVGHRDLSGEENRPTTGDFVEFFRNFADRRHHGKEEDLLFKEMQRKGMSGDAGPIGVMLTEHDIGRKCVGAMAAVAEGTGALSEGEQKQLVSAAQEFVPMLRQHIQKEDLILFPMADNILAEGEISDLNDRFNEFDKRVIGENDDRRLRALAQTLKDTWR